MLTISGTVLTIEGGFACLFFALLTMERRRGRGKEDILWGLVWVTRLFASLYGSRYVAANGAELTVYVALQACSGLSLMLVLARYELKVYKERLFRRMALRLTEREGKPAVESITIRQTTAQ